MSTTENTEGNSDTFRAKLGRTEEVVEYDIFTEKCGVVGDLEYTRVSIDPVCPSDVPDEDIDVNIKCIHDMDVKNGMQYSTIIIDEMDFDEVIPATPTVEEYSNHQKNQKVKVVKGLKLKNLIENDDAVSKAGVFNSEEAENYFNISRSNKKVGKQSAAEEVFASDPDMFNLKRKPTESNYEEIQTEEDEGIFPSDPDALKFLKFSKIQPQQQNATCISNSIQTVKTATSNIAKKPEEITEDNAEEEGIFASDSDALKNLKFVRIQHNNATSTNSSIVNGNGKEFYEHDEEGIFASDPDALKNLKFTKINPNPTREHLSPTKNSTQQQNDQEEGLIASDSDVPKTLQFSKIQCATTSNQQTMEPDELFFDHDEEGVFASDPEALKFLKFSKIEKKSNVGIKDGGFEKTDENSKLCDQSQLTCIPKPRINSDSDSVASKDKDGTLESVSLSGVNLEKGDDYHVTVTSEMLPNGQLKKNIEVRGQAGCDNLEQKDVSQMEATVESWEGENGMVQKFFSVTN